MADKTIPEWAKYAKTFDGHVYQRTLVPTGWIPGPDMPSGPMLTNDELLALDVVEFRSV